ncbi:MAG: hypothetical protein ACTSU3_00545, partial [Candidatus Thorarchaeota archaeon]
MEALKAALREILCAALSLDDGLSIIQNLAIGDKEHSDIYFDVARSLEEILLRRPGLASAKLTELNVRLSFSKDPILPELLMLIESRFTNIHRRAESEILPDIDAIPYLLDILGELAFGVSSAIKLNLRPLLPFLADEVLLTLEAIHTRCHKASIQLAVSEAHYLSIILSESGLFDCAEAILNKLIAIAKEMSLDDILFDVSLDGATVLTELGLYEQSREILTELKAQTETMKDPVKLAAVSLQQAINQTRDESVGYEAARIAGDEAAQFFEKLLDIEGSTKEGLGLALLVIGSNILANGCREGVLQAIERLESSLEVLGEIEVRDGNQTRILFRCLAGLGFGYGMMSGHDNLTQSIDYLERAKSVIAENNPRTEVEYRIETARCNHAIGWICLGSDSDEYWRTGTSAFELAIEERKKLHAIGRVSDLELIGSKMGLALSNMRDSLRQKREFESSLYDVLVQYVPLFPVDSRGFSEIAIATYNIVWLNFRHGGMLPQRLLRFLDDVDRMLSDARMQNESVFIQGVSLVVPYLNESWTQLRKRAEHIIHDKHGLSDIAHIISALAISKSNLESVSFEVSASPQDPVTEPLKKIAPLLAQYWSGQTALIDTMKSYYGNEDYSILATGLHRTAYTLSEVEAIETESNEAGAFVRATAISLARILKRFALCLEIQYGAYIDRSTYKDKPFGTENGEVEFLLAEDWLGLLKITGAYLDMVENADMKKAKPYLNAVFSNIASALRMMDNV